MRYIFAGDRDIACHVLKVLIERGQYPEALLVSSEKKASHADELIALSKLDESKIYRGIEFKEAINLENIKSIGADYIIGIHFPYLISKEILEIPKKGFLNLHPAFLPYNRGWHTPSWAIEENTPIGATLHFMSEELDMGDIIAQKQVDILPHHTANELYQEVKRAELELFEECADDLISGKELNRMVQDPKAGTDHVKKDLYEYEKRRIKFGKNTDPEDLLRSLRAFTTSDVKEAMYFEKDGKRYSVQVKITPLDDNLK